MAHIDRASRSSSLINLAAPSLLSLLCALTACGGDPFEAQGGPTSSALSGAAGSTSPAAGSAGQAQGGGQSAGGKQAAAGSPSRGGGAGEGGQATGGQATGGQATGGQASAGEGGAAGSAQAGQGGNVQGGAQGGEAPGGQGGAQAGQGGDAGAAQGGGAGAEQGGQGGAAAGGENAGGAQGGAGGGELGGASQGGNEQGGGEQGGGEQGGSAQGGAAQGGGEQGGGEQGGGEQGGGEQGGGEQGGAGQGGAAQGGGEQGGGEQGGAGQGGGEQGGAGQGGGEQGGAAQGGSAGEGGAAGQGGSAGSAGSGGAVDCGPCSLWQGCGYGDKPGVCGGETRVRSGYVQSDGAAAFEQVCDITKEGALDCDPATHPFVPFVMPGHAEGLPEAVKLADRFTAAYFAGGKQRLLNGFLEAGGLREWVQICDVSPKGGLDCGAAAHPFAERKLTSGLPLEAGTTVGGRFLFVYEKSGKLVLRNGYVQSNGTKSHSQTCDLTDGGTFDCDPATHPFSTFSMPPSGASLDLGTTVIDRLSVLFRFGEGQRIHNGFVQSDAQKTFWQSCDADLDGAFTCPSVPMTIEATPKVPVANGTKALYRYSYAYVE